MCVQLMNSARTPGPIEIGPCTAIGGMTYRIREKPAWHGMAFVKKEFNSAVVLDERLAEFASLLAEAKEWLQQADEEWHVLLHLATQANQLSLSCGQAAGAARSQEQKDARASGKQWVTELLDAGAGALHK